MSQIRDINKTLKSLQGTAESRAGKYLTFRLAAEEYGLEILKVREIIGLMKITKVPQTPQYIRGVINLRGKVIPVLELRLKFGIEAMEDSEQTCIVVVDVFDKQGSVMTGIVVDSVSEVLDINGAQIEDAPVFGAGIDTDFILGIGKINEDVKILLDIDKVLDISEMLSITKKAVTSEKMVEKPELEEATT